MKTFSSGGSEIFIGEGSLDALSNHLTDRFPDHELLILTDENTLQYCLPIVVSAAEALADAQVLEIECGEENKVLSLCEQLWLAMAEGGFSRKTLLINLGGGVVTDMGGFIASVYKRGIPFINVPTSLLAQVDASVGGKCGIDLGPYKNMLGTFTPANAVFISPVFLSTLPGEEIVSGFAEVLKHALIADRDYWETLKSVDPSANEGWDSIINRSVEIKRSIVESDPLEKGPRKALNFGHTAGHAIEGYYLSSNSPLKHGSAVAAGMIIEAFLSQKYAGLKQEAFNEIEATIDGIFEKIEIPLPAVDKMLQLMKNDKKNEAQEINFTFLSDIGSSIVNCTASEDEITEAMKYYIHK